VPQKSILALDGTPMLTNATYQGLSLRTSQTQGVVTT